VSGVVLFGCKSTTRYLYNALSPGAPIRAIVTLDPAAARKHEVADYDDLDDLSSAVEIYRAQRYSLSDERDLEFFSSRNFSLGLAMGWQRLLPDAVLASIRSGVYGMHGSSQNLPFGRGRSPMNWSIIEGRRWFHTNLFKYQPGVDDGPVAASACFSILPADTAETLHFKNLLAMTQLVNSNLGDLLAGKVELRDQPAHQATYYPKREPADSIIDWGVDVLALDRHIRAVSPPFGGAFTFCGGDRVTIIRATILYTDLEAHPFQAAAPGVICAIMPNDKFLVRCVGGVLLVHEFERGSSSNFRSGDRLESPQPIRNFPRNHFGNFDLPRVSSE
jgi:UDP-4-amino-4-deoxy-L-arabinose formyltransferase/UDP-glucuronic acid dehydrogenase (UDP-4-keto-hexauronic acid decarboxylating)